MSVVYVGQGIYQVILDPIEGFAISPRRMQSTKTALAGNVIRQSSILHASNAQATYNGVIDSDLAESLRDMHAVSSSVTVHHMGRGYEASMDYEERGYLAGGRVAVTITFGVVREIQ